MKDTCKQEQKAAQTKVLCPKDATFVHSYNHHPLSAAAKDRLKHRPHSISSLSLSQLAYHLLNIMGFFWVFLHITQVISKLGKTREIK